MTENRSSNDSGRQPPVSGEARPDADEHYRALVENSSEGIWRFDFEPPVETSVPWVRRWNWPIVTGF